MTLDQRLTQAVRHVADSVPPPVVDVAAVCRRARTNRHRAVFVTVTAVVMAVVLGGTALIAGRDTSAPAPVDPVHPPRLAGGLPVWYDEAGLHVGGRVEQPAVELFEAHWGGGVLALVQGGAVYRDPALGDVWYHPWGGRPRVVGHSETGPGGDPKGDVAAWFDGSDLVVFDTARGRDISRSLRVPMAPFHSLDHLNSGTQFRHISADEVVWVSEDAAGTAVTRRVDLRTGQSSVLWENRRNLLLADVHGATRIWGDLSDGKNGGMVVAVRGRDERRPGAVEPFGRLSAAGSYVLAATVGQEAHGAAVVDVRSGEMWRLLPGERRFYAWISWSYGDLALVLVDQDGQEQRLLACDASKQVCRPLPRQGTVLLPSS